MQNTAYHSFLQEIFARSGPQYGAGESGFKRLLSRLGNPQNGYKIIHVAGTNGKGSVCHLCAAVLQEAGYKTGLFVSPHLFSPVERIRINGRLISKISFARLCRKVLDAEEEKLNFFEIITAAAFLYFSKNKVQYAVLETGLGGRKDPTNICLPSVCIITSIGLDHCALLGNTLAQVAKEKAGIIKAKVPVFCPPLEQEAANEIKKMARSADAPLRVVREGEPFFLSKIDWAGGCLLLQKNKALWPLRLLGEKQTQNACLVYNVCRFLSVKDAALKRAFAKINVPCRFERVRAGNNILLFDGAHNPQAARALGDFFVRSPQAQNAALVCGFMRDKDYKEMLRLLAPRFTALYVTVPRSPRAASLEQVRLALEELGQKEHSGFAYKGKGPFLYGKTNVFFFSSPARALAAARAAHKTAVITGSFYLAGYLRARKGLTANAGL